MAEFQPCFDWTISWEGKALEQVPDDPGGMTFWGISRVNNPEWPGWALVDAHLRACDNIHEASYLCNQDEALVGMVERFYQQAFVHGEFDGIAYQELALQAFDKFWNMGSAAVKALQEMVLAEPDGIIGPLTLDALNNHLDPSTLVDQFLEWCQKHYQDIVARNPAMGKFLNGWLNRCRRSDKEAGT